MSTRNDILELEDKIININKNISEIESKKAWEKYLPNISLYSLAYVGIRTIFGADMNIMNKLILQDSEISLTKIVNGIDVTAIAAGVILPIYNFIEFINDYTIERSYKKELRNTTEKLKIVKEDYKFSHGYD